jgi:transketolase
MHGRVIDITDKNIKLWSTVGPRATFGLVLLEIARYREELLVVTADVSSSAGLDRFAKTFPDRFVDVGIAEQNMIGIAAGLADNGYEVFTTTFAPFQTLRCLDQIKVNLAYSNIKATMVGLASGLVNGPLGNTHCCIEDVGALRSIPNITIMSPADGVGVAKSVLASFECTGPVYIRLTGGVNNPIVYDKDVHYRVGEAIEVRNGLDLTIFATGTMVYNSIVAAEFLAKRGVSASVVDMHTIKPIDTSAIKKAVTKGGMVVTVEEHNVIGGLGSAVSEALARVEGAPPVLSIGVEDVFLQAGTYSYMLEQSGLTPESISDRILNRLGTMIKGPVS